VKALIVNADDFGLAESINRGIIKGHREGFITSTSLMCSAPAFKDAVALAQENLRLGVGIHLTLVGGVAPVLPPEQVPTLVDARGVFPENYVLFAKKLYTGGVKLSELKAELTAQISRGLATGLPFTHLDSHQHLHVLPGVSAVVLQLCREFKFKAVRVPGEAYLWNGGFKSGPVRILGKCGLTFCASLFRQQLSAYGLVAPDHFFGMLAGGNLDERLVGNILTGLPDGVSEIMTHPGLDAAGLAQKFTWGYHWEQELQAFLAPANKEKLTANKIQLMNFGDLTNA
jgi:hopanoid biosynthesis associated protein HpnK